MLLLYLLLVFAFVAAEEKDKSEELLDKCYKKLEPYEECYPKYTDLTGKELEAVF